MDSTITATVSAQDSHLIPCFTAACEANHEAAKGGGIERTIAFSFYHRA
jgi:hypothetical protein